MPGASAAKLRKLRSSCGRFSICCGVTLVAASAVRVSRYCSPVTVIDSLTVVVVNRKVMSRFCPTRTVTVSERGSSPAADTVILYSPGVRPPSWKVPSAPDEMVVTNPEVVPTASILALASAAPLSLVTLPWIVAVEDWATAAAARVPTSNVHSKAFNIRLMTPLLFFVRAASPPEMRETSYGIQGWNTICER